MKYNIQKFKGRNYLPLVEDSKFWDSWDEKYLYKESERLGVDRVKAIYNDIDSKGTLLDIGCNIGLLSHIFQQRGFDVTGIENDIHVNVKNFVNNSSINLAKELSDIYDIKPEFIDDDYIRYIRSSDRVWDYVLYLSVFHHHFLGYGHSDFQRFSVAEAESVFLDVWNVCDKVMYFEIDGFIDGVVKSGWGQDKIVDNIKRLTGVVPVEIYKSPDGWRNPRSIFRIKKDG